MQAHAEESLQPAPTDWEEGAQENPEFQEAVAFLARIGVVPGPEGFTIRQLAGELARRGWRWRLDDREVEAQKAYTLSETVQYSIAEPGATPISSLAIILMKAIRFDTVNRLSPLSPFRADIVVRDGSGNVVALVEAKNLEDLTSHVATEIRRNLLSYRSELSVPFFLLASQDTGYLWSRASGLEPFDSPAVILPTRSVVAHYLPWLGPGERLHGSQLEFVLAGWLTDLSSGRGSRPTEPEESLAGTGFLEAISGASVHWNETP